MFESITSGLQNIFDKLRGKGKLTPENMEEGLSLVKRALLQADVNYKIVKDFTAGITEKAMGEEVIKGATPAQQFVKIVHDELLKLMGETDTRIPYKSPGPTVIMMAGLQGSGKTTTVGKLAHYLMKQNRRPLLVAADIQRPAAIEQLKVVGAGVGAPVYTEPGGYPPRICKNAIAVAQKDQRDVVILDTAGRLHIDEKLMEELEEVAKLTSPDQIFLVVDAMTGQDAVNSAKAFSDRLRLDGVILTKLDGDARGGAAISIRAVTGKPIKFCGVGEKTEDFEEFHTDRMVSRILGLGDVLTLWEKAKDKIDEEEAKKFQNQLVQGELTLDGFLKQLEQVQKMGPIKELMAMIPGVSSMMKDVEVDEKEFTHMKAMIQSMTLEERRNPDVIDHSRRVRISKGSGTDHMDVGRLVKQFKMMRKMVSKQTGLFGRLMGKGNMPVPSMDNLDSMPGVTTTTLKDKRMSMLKREKARQERKIRKKEQKKHSR